MEPLKESERKETTKSSKYAPAAALTEGNLKAFSDQRSLSSVSIPGVGVVHHESVLETTEYHDGDPIVQFRAALRKESRMGLTSSSVSGADDPTRPQGSGVRIDDLQREWINREDVNKVNVEDSSYASAALRSPHLLLPNAALRHFWSSFFSGKEYVRWSVWETKMEEHMATPADLPATEFPIQPYGYGLHKNELALLFDESLFGRSLMRSIRRSLDMEETGVLSVYALIPVLKSIGIVCSITDCAVLDRLPLKHLLYLLGHIAAKVVLPSIERSIANSSAAAHRLNESYQHAVAAVADRAINRTATGICTFDSDFVQFLDTALFAAFDSPTTAADDGEGFSGAPADINIKSPGATDGDLEYLLGPRSLQISLELFLDDARRQPSPTGFRIVAGPRGQGTSSRVLAAVRSLLGAAQQKWHSLMKGAAAAGGQLSAFDLSKLGVNPRQPSDGASCSATVGADFAQPVSAAVRNSTISFSYEEVADENSSLSPMFDCLYIDLRGRISYADILSAFAVQLGIRGTCCSLQVMQDYLSRLLRCKLRPNSLLVLDHVSVLEPGCSQALRRVLFSAQTGCGGISRSSLGIVVVPLLTSATPILPSRHLEKLHPGLLELVAQRQNSTGHIAGEEELRDMEQLVEIECEDAFLLEIEQVTAVLGATYRSSSASSRPRDNVQSSDSRLPDGVFLHTYSLSIEETASVAHHLHRNSLLLSHSWTTKASSKRGSGGDARLRDESVAGLSLEDSHASQQSNKDNESLPPSIRHGILDVSQECSYRGSTLISDSSRLLSSNAVKLICALSGGVPSIIVFLVQQLQLTDLAPEKVLQRVLQHWVQRSVEYCLRLKQKPRFPRVPSYLSTANTLQRAEAMSGDKAEVEEIAPVFRLPNVFRVGMDILQDTFARGLVNRVQSDAQLLWCAMGPLLRISDYLLQMVPQSSTKESANTPAPMLSPQKEPFAFSMEIAWQLSKSYFSSYNASAKEIRFRYRDWLSAWEHLLQRAWIQPHLQAPAFICSAIGIIKNHIPEVDCMENDEIIRRKLCLVKFNVCLLSFGEPLRSARSLRKGTVESQDNVGSGSDGDVATNSTAAAAAVEQYFDYVLSRVASLSSTLAAADLALAVPEVACSCSLSQQRHIMLLQELDACLLPHFSYVVNLFTGILALDRLTSSDDNAMLLSSPGGSIASQISLRNASTWKASATTDLGISDEDSMSIASSTNSTRRSNSIRLEDGSDCRADGGFAFSFEASRSTSETMHNIRLAEEEPSQSKGADGIGGDQDTAAAAVIPSPSLRGGGKLARATGSNRLHSLFRHGDKGPFSAADALNMLAKLKGSLRMISLLRLPHDLATLVALHMSKICRGASSDEEDLLTTASDFYDIGELLLELHLLFIGLYPSWNNSGSQSSCCAGIIDCAESILQQHAPISGANAIRLIHSSSSSGGGRPRTMMMGSYLISQAVKMLRKAHMIFSKLISVGSSADTGRRVSHQDEWMRRITFGLGRSLLVCSADEERRKRLRRRVKYDVARGEDAFQSLIADSRSAKEGISLLQSLLDRTSSEQDLKSERTVLSRYQADMKRWVNESAAIAVHDKQLGAPSSDSIDAVLGPTETLAWMKLFILVQMPSDRELGTSIRTALFLKLQGDVQLLLAEFQHQFLLRNKLDDINAQHLSSLLSPLNNAGNIAATAAADAAIRSISASSSLSAFPPVRDPVSAAAVSTSLLGGSVGEVDLEPASEENLIKEAPQGGAIGTGVNKEHVKQAENSAAIDQHCHMRFPLVLHTGRINLTEETIDEHYLQKVQADSESSNGSSSESFRNIRALYSNSLSVYKRAFGASSLVGAESALRFGNFLRAHGFLDDSKNLFEDALKTFKFHKVATYQLPQASPADCWLALGAQFAVETGKVDLTVRLYEEAIGLYEALFAADHFANLLTVEALLPHLKAQGNIARASELLKRNIVCMRGGLAAANRALHSQHQLLQRMQQSTRTSSAKKLDCIAANVACENKTFFISRKLTSALLQLAALYEVQQQYDQSAAVYKEAIVLLREQRMMILSEQRNQNQLKREEERTEAATSEKASGARSVHFDVSVAGEEKDSAADDAAATEHAMRKSSRLLMLDSSLVERDIVLCIADTMRKLAQALFEDGKKLLGSMTSSGHSVPDLHYRNITYIMDRVTDIYGEFDLHQDGAKVAQLLVAALQQKSGFHAAQNDLDVAKDCYENAMKIFMEVKMPNYELVAVVQREFARLLVQCGEFGEAAMLFQQSIDIFRRKRGEMYIDREMARCLLERGSALIDTAAFEEAQPVLEDCMTMLHMLYGEEGAGGASDSEQLVAACHCHLAAVFHHFEEHAEALLEYNLAVKIYRNMRDMRHTLELANVYNNLATLHDDMGNVEDAKKMYEEAIIILFRYHGNSHAQISVTLENLMNLLGDMGLVQEQRNVEEHIEKIEATIDQQDAAELERLESLNRALYGAAVAEQEQRSLLLRRTKIAAAIAAAAAATNASSNNNGSSIGRSTRQTSQIPDLIIQSDNFEAPEFDNGEVDGDNFAAAIDEEALIYDYHHEYLLEERNAAYAASGAMEDGTGGSGSNFFELGIHRFEDGEDDFLEDDELQLELELSGGDDVEGGRAGQINAATATKQGAADASSAAKVLNVGEMMSFLGGFNDRSALHAMHASLGQDTAGVGGIAGSRGRYQQQQAIGLRRHRQQFSSAAGRGNAAVAANTAEDELPSGNCRLM